jgi:hypothetical protein
MEVGFEVPTAVVMKSSIFWDITPCSPLKVNWCFGGTCRLHLQGLRIQERILRKVGIVCCLLHAAFLLGPLTLETESLFNCLRYYSN